MCTDVSSRVRVSVIEGYARDENARLKTRIASRLAHGESRPLRFPCVTTGPLFSSIDRKLIFLINYVRRENYARGDAMHADAAIVFSFLVVENFSKFSPLILSFASSLPAVTLIEI